MKQLTKTERFILENAIHHTAWKHIDEKFDHEIYLEMNPGNCSGYLKFFDFIKYSRWVKYARDN